MKRALKSTTTRMMYGPCLGACSNQQKCKEILLKIFREIWWRRQWQPTPVLLPGKSHGQRSLVGCSHGVAKSQTGLSDFTFTFHFHAVEKEMAAHSSILAWRIPGRAEPGGLLSKGSHRVRHNWSDLAAAVAAAEKYDGWLGIRWY